MDIPQTRSLLQKISQLVDSVDLSQGNVSRLERDLLLDYTRRLYETLAAEASMQAVPEVPVHRSTPVPDPVSQVAFHAPVAVDSSGVKPGSISDNPDPTPALTGSSAPASAPEPIESEQPPIPEVQIEAVVEEVPAPQESITEEKAPEPPSTSIPVVTQVSTAVDMSALFVQPEARDLGDKLRLSRIEDLSRAMGINERFLTINELFGGNHETFDNVLRHLNSLSTFENARHYLEQEVIPAFGWMDDKKQKKAAIFIQLVQRRYL